MRRAICDPGTQNQSYVARVSFWAIAKTHCIGQNYRFFLNAKIIRMLNKDHVP